jgi:Uma2 family endonuclease
MLESGQGKEGPVVLEAKRAHVTADELLQISDHGGRFELLQGRLMPMSPTSVDHGGPLDNLYFALAQHVRAHGLGKLYPAETGFNLRQPGEVEDTVLAADITFVQRPRVPAAGGPAYPLLVPDLVVEVASEASQRPRDMADKARLWLGRGVRRVWVVWPRRRRVDVWTPEAAEPRRLGRDDLLDGGEVVPGFSVQVAAVFEA